MLKSTGKVTEVSKFSETEDQMTIESKIPSPLGEEGQTHRHDWVMPAGTAKVGDIVKVEIIEP